MDDNKLKLNRKTKKAAKPKIVEEGKNKGFSCKTTTAIFNNFSKINAYYGMSNNSVINQLMVKYIRENQSLLDELNNK